MDVFQPFILQGIQYITNTGDISNILINLRLPLIILSALFEFTPILFTLLFYDLLIIQKSFIVINIF